MYITYRVGNQRHDGGVLSVQKMRTLGAELQWMHGYGIPLITGPFSTNIL
jgi:hypothetical protein